MSRPATRSVLAPAALAAMVLMTGCVTVCESPLYTAADIATDLPLEGSWIDANSDAHAPGWKFTRHGSGYTVVETEKGSPPLEVHLLRLGKWHFLDIFLPDRDLCDATGHLIAKVSMEGDRLHVALVNDTWLANKAREFGWDVVEPPHNADHNLLVKAPTAQLQRLMLQDAGDPQAFDEPQVLRRAPATPAPSPAP
jgi:hypothetical protein